MHTAEARDSSCFHSGKPEGIVPEQANHPNEDLSKKLAIWFNGFARGSIMPGHPQLSSYLSTEVDR